MILDDIKPALSDLQITVVFCEMHLSRLPIYAPHRHGHPHV